MIPLSFIWVFVVTMAIGLPIVFALSLAPIFGFLVADKAFFLQTLPQKLYIGINQFPLLVRKGRQMKTPFLCLRLCSPSRLHVH